MEGSMPIVRLSFIVLIRLFFRLGEIGWTEKGRMIFPGISTQIIDRIRVSNALKRRFVEKSVQ